MSRLGRARLLPLVFLVGACAARQEPAAPVVEVPAVEVDPALAAEAVSLTQALIRAAPENPPGREGRAAALLVERLEAAGIPVEIAPFGGPERVSLLARLPATEPSGARPLLLYGHLDVVPAEAAAWREPAGPFAGVVQQGELVGRGALDMLSMVALEALTLVALERADLPLSRDVLLLLVGDEEGRGEGMRAALERWPEISRAEWALGEGGFLLEEAPLTGRPAAAVSVAEKGLFQFRLVARGQSAHGSSPPDDPATTRLVHALSRLFSAPREPRVVPETARMLEALGQARGGLYAAALSNEDLVEALAPGALAGDPKARALLDDTCALTQLSAGYKGNVIPGEASATVDCRLLPGTRPEAFRDEVLRRLDEPRLTLEVLDANPASGSPPEGPLLDVIRARMRREQADLPLVPIVTPGYTDGRFLRPLGVHVYGFAPIFVSRDELAGIHGEDERVRVQELKQGLGRLVDVVAALARAP